MHSRSSSNGGTRNTVLTLTLTLVEEAYNKAPYSRYLLAESTEIFDVYAGHEVCLGAFERHHATVVFIQAITYGAADVMRTRF